MSEQSLEEIMANLGENDVPESNLAEQEPKIEPNQAEPEENLSDDVETFASPEEEAAVYGWKPESEWNKDKGEWQTAEEFLAHRRRNPLAEKKALKKNNIKLASDLSKLQSSVDSIIQHQARQLEMERKAAYDQAQRELKTQIEQAVERGDINAVTQLLESRDQLAEAVRSVPAQNAQQVVVERWKQENDWYEKDQDLNVFATAYEDKLAKEGVPLEARLEMTTKKVKEMFAHKFENDAPSAAQVTTITTSQKPSSVRQKPKTGTYEALTPEWKRECDAFVAVQIARKTPRDKAIAEWLQYAPTDAYVS